MKKTMLLISSVFLFTACEATEEPIVLERINHEGGTISGGESWEIGIHVVQGDINVEGGPLTVAACSIIEMPDGGVIRARDDGSLNFVGRADCPITITSSRSSRAAGDWNQIEIYGDASNVNTLDWVIVEFGGGSVYGSIWLDDGANLSMSNSTVNDSGDVGLSLYDGAHFSSFVNNALVDNAQGAMDIYPSAVGDLGVGVYGPNDIDGIFVQGGTLAEDATWLAHDAPYVFEGDVNIEHDSGSARLTVAAGATIEMGDSRDLRVRTNGGLTLAGTAIAPVTITSAKAVPAPGDWNQIEIYSDSVGAYNDFDYAIIEYGGGSVYGSIWLDDGANLSMSNSTVRDSDDFGLYLYDGAHFSSFVNNTLIDNAEGAMHIYPSAVGDLGVGVYGPNTNDGIFVYGGTLAEDATWLAHDAPYVFEGNVNIEHDSGSAALTVEAGATIEMGDHGILSVRTNGGLTLAGTAIAPVTITSAKPVPVPGSWNQIEIYWDSVPAYNDFTYVDIEYGGGSVYGQLWLDDGADVALDNVIFSDAGDSCDIDGVLVTVPVDSVFTYCP